MRKMLRAMRAMVEVSRRPVGMGRPHSMDAPVVVSLTSYPGRYPSLGHTLRALLRQSVRPNHVILWLNEADRAELPDHILRLRDEGLEISLCPNWRSFQKIVPTLLRHPDAYIVTADDDVYYPQDWLETLLNEAGRGNPVAAIRTHRIRLGADGNPLPYRDWDWKYDGCDADSAPLIFLTGVGGAVYAPGALHADVTRHDLFTRLCPTSDDVWLYWMYRMNGHYVAKVRGDMTTINWPGSQRRSLQRSNTGAKLGNDAALAAMVSHYGFPRR